MSVKMKRGGVTVNVGRQDIDGMLATGWALVEEAPEPQPEPSPAKPRRRRKAAPKKAVAPAPSPAPVRSGYTPGPGFSYPWPPEAPSPYGSRKDWAAYARSLGIEPGYMTRGELHDAAIAALEGASA